MTVRDKKIELLKGKLSELDLISLSEIILQTETYNFDNDTELLEGIAQEFYKEESDY